MSGIARNIVGPPPAHPQAPGDDLRSLWAWLTEHPWLAALLASTLGLLLVHAWSYRFLTDDAFIAFRYARNLAHGDGLVFNPGLERVEGFTSLLWVLLLAGAARLGLTPEKAAPLMSLLLTVALWWIVVRETLRRPLEPGRDWLVLIPPAFLAAIRSVAVWSSGGLETRLFEVLLLAGVFRLAREVRALVRGERRWPLAALLLGLAEWARPEGLLLGGAALLAAALFVIRRRRADLGALLPLAMPFVLLVGAHFAFRWLYFGAWLPNTYYVKIDGRTWWTLGFAYLAAFVLEYGLYLWVPLLVLGARRLAQEGQVFGVWITAALIAPLALYLAAIGGDHFEYRPLDLVFPLLLLLLYDGLREWTRSPSGLRWAAPVLGVLLVLLWQLPSQSRRQSPAYYSAGFPGGALDTVEGRTFLAPARDPIYRWPPLRAVALAHQRLVRACTVHFVGLRREEHARFLETLWPAANALRELGERGVLPRDFKIAVPCVGLIPYVSDLPTLDRLGLTDAHVAHQRFYQKRKLAHDKTATLDYARQREVDLWCDVRPVCSVTALDFLGPLDRALGELAPMLAAPLGGGSYLVGEAPLGPERLARRAPRLRFESMAGTEFVDRFATEAIAVYRERVRRRAADDDARLQLATLLGTRGGFDEALEQYRVVSTRRTDDPEVWLRIAWCHAHRGRKGEAVAAIERAIEVARLAGDAQGSRALEMALARLKAASADARSLTSAVNAAE